MEEQNSTCTLKYSNQFFMQNLGLGGFGKQYMWPFHVDEFCTINGTKYIKKVRRDSGFVINWIWYSGTPTGADL